MAYGFGSGVRPELGATDYSNYLRGALTGAQMQAQGGAAIGAGVQNALTGIGKGIEKYQQKKKEKKQLQQSIEFAEDLFKQNPTIAKSLGITADASGELDNKEIEAGINALGGPAQFIQFGVGMQNMLQEQKASEAKAKQEQMQQEIADFQNEIQEFSNIVSGGGMKLNQVPPMYRAQVANLVREREAELRKLESEGQLKPASPSTFEAVYERMRKARESELGRPLTATEDADVAQKAQRGSAAQTNIDLGADTTDRVTATKAVERNIEILERAENAVKTIEKIDRLIDLAESGDANTGIFSSFLQAKDRVLAALGGEGAARKATATQILEAAQGSEVFQLFQALGVGARGLDTPAERDFMLKVLTGMPNMTPDAIVALAQERRNLLAGDVEKFNSRLDSSPKFGDWVESYNYGPMSPFTIPERDEADDSNSTGNLDPGLLKYMTPEQQALFQ